MTTDELAGLPEDVREALSYFADAETALEGEGHNGTMYATICAEMLRLARENADLASQVEGWKLEASRRSTYRDRAERAEAELAALKRRIAGATTAEVFEGMSGAGMVTSAGGLPREWIGQRVALLPVGGEGQ